jgi:hypothetical protein
LNNCTFFFVKIQYNENYFLGRKCVLVLDWMGLPEDVVKGMLKVVKKVHEDFSLGEDIVFWLSNAPTLVQVSHPTLGRTMKFYVKNDNDRGLSRINNFRLRRANTIEFKREWRLQSIEERKKGWEKMCIRDDMDEEEKNINRK